MKGLLVTLEGQDACGKTTLLPLLAEKLQKLGIKVVTIPEFSSNVIGSFIEKTLKESKFFKLGKNNPSAFTETMYMVSDLYSQDELEIRPAIENGYVVIKDRHIDSILSCQIPRIINNYPKEDQKVIFEWLSYVIKKILSPNITFFLKINDEIRRQRIMGRGENFSPSDEVVFKERQKIYDLITETNKTRWVEILNEDSVETTLDIMIKNILERY